MAYQEYFLGEQISVEASGVAGPFIINNSNQREYLNPNAKVYIRVSNVAGTASPSITPFLTKNFVDAQGISIDFPIHDPLTPITAVGEVVFDIVSCPDLVKVKWAITGTDPVFSFSTFISR